MGGKLTPIIIILLLLIIVGIGFFAFNLLAVDHSNNTNTVQEVLAEPIVELAQEIDEKKEKATITVSAYTDDGTPIKEIILPDDSDVVDSEATYVVEKNGTYEFTVYAENGKSTTQSITIEGINEISDINPYIPEGFSALGGEPNSGFVIEDKYGNQYVWVPVPTGKLTRNTMLDTDYEDTNNAASELVNSVAKYYGFYIARFETSQYELNGEIVAATMAGKNPWTNINGQDAINVSSKSGEIFGYTDSHTALISSYAWDTVLEWVDKSVTNYSSNTNYGNYSGTIYPTGNTSDDMVNHICDLAGNVREWTTEIYKSGEEKSKRKSANNETVIYRVVRGGSANLNRTPSAHIGYAEDTSDNYWGFRMVLYR